MKSIIIQVIIFFPFFISFDLPKIDFQHMEENGNAVAFNKYNSDFSACFKVFQQPEKWNFTIEGFSPAYYDKTREAIAVNTVEQPTDQWAAASTLFEHSSGVYTIRFTSLLESDGECSYILRIGGKKVMDFQNPRIYGKDIEEYAPHDEVVENITIEKGSLIRVEFLPHSNGLVPEGDGFGFARARWRSNIEFILQQEK